MVIWNSDFGRFALRCLYACLYIVVFLFAFQPFGLYTYSVSEKTSIFLGFGVATLVTLLISYMVLDMALKTKVQPSRWLLVDFILRSLFISVGINLFAYYIELTAFNFNTLLIFTGITFSMALFPKVAYLLFVDQSFLRKDSNQNSPKENQLVHLPSDNKSESVFVDQSKLLYIKASRNYCEAVLHSNGAQEKYLIRSTLKDMDQAIQEETIVRCHRSFIINLKQVERHNNQNSSSQLRLMNGETVPVSRKYAPRIKQLL